MNLKLLIRKLNTQILLSIFLLFQIFLLFNISQIKNLNDIKDYSPVLHLAYLVLLFIYLPIILLMEIYNFKFNRNLLSLVFTIIFSFFQYLLHFSSIVKGILVLMD
jgi:hypothetical protein